MPCYESEEEKEFYRTLFQERRSKESIERFGIDMTDINIATRVACEACRLLYACEDGSELSEEAQQWYAAHKILDQEREASEA